MLRQMGEGIPVYEVKPEQGRGRSRVLHRNLLLLCDHLPLETDLQTNPKRKRNTSVAPATGTDLAEEDEEEEYGFFFEPSAHAKRRPTCALEGERNIMHADSLENHELETQVTNTELEPEETHDMDEHQDQENIETQTDESHGEEQPDEVME